MGKKLAHDLTFRPEDYNEPTQPMRTIFPPPTESPFTVGGWYPNAQTVSATQPGIPPSPYAGMPAYPFYQLPASPVYPVLPPASSRNSHRQAPGRSPLANRPAYTKKRRRSPIPGLVRLFFVLVQILLLARIVLSIVGIPATTFWLKLLFEASNLFVWPTRLLAANINTSVLTGTELLIYLEFLLAILIYGLLSLLLVSCLRALLQHETY